MTILEVCAGSIESAIMAQNGGAQRVELCNNLAQGGITPSIAQIRTARNILDIDLNILIRPREGDFLYDDIEFEIMQQDIHHCGIAGCNGVVFGILTEDGEVDKKRNKVLVKIAHQYNMSITFHRAFDKCADLYQSLEDVIELGCDRILTSGGKVTAPQGKDILKELIIKADNRIIIMPGGGITEDNISELAIATGVIELHGSFRSTVNGKMRYKSPVFNQQEEYNLLVTDSEKVRKAISNVNNR